MLQLQEKLNKVKYKMIDEEEINKLICDLRIFWLIKKMSSQ